MRTFLIASLVSLIVVPSARAAIVEYPASGGPEGIARAADGSIWITEYTGQALARVDADGHVTVEKQLSAGRFPEQIVSGSDGDLWFTENGADRIGRYDPRTGVLAEIPTPTTGSGPEGITSGPDGAIWFTEPETDIIGRVNTTTQAVTEFFLTGTHNGALDPRDLAFGADNTLWITLNHASGGLARLDPATAVPNTTTGVTFYNLPTAFTSPNGIVRGPDDRLWVAEFGDGEVASIDTAAVSPNTSNGITEYPVSGSPFHAAVAGDGNLWFTQNQSHQLVRFSPSDHVGTTFDVSGDPTQAASDGDGNLWFTENNTNKIGEVVLFAPTATPTPTPVPTPPPTGGTTGPAQLTVATPGATVGQPLALQAAPPPGETATGYTFTVGSTTTSCPPQDPRLAITATQAATVPAGVAITTARGTVAAYTSLSVGTGQLPAVKLAGGKLLAGSSPGKALDALGIVALACEPAGGPSSAAGNAAHPTPRSYEGLAQPLTTGAQIPAGCSGPGDEVKLGIVDGFGCFVPTAFKDLSAADRKIVCGHLTTAGQRACRTEFDNAVLRIPTNAAQSRLTELFDQFWVAKGPVSIDGLEVDPVGGGDIVLARAGVIASDFAKQDAAYVISTDAMVRIGGLPLTLQVPDYSKLYRAGATVADCAQKVANGDADCLGSVGVPDLSAVANAFKLPQIHGPIDVGVAPQDLGIELGSFEIPKNTLPLPLLPSLGLSGKITVHLTGAGAASVAVHVELPILSDDNGHGLTGDTTLNIDNQHGLQVDNLAIDVPSLAQIGLARLHDLHFGYQSPSHFDGHGTIDLSDVIHGNVTAHVVFDKGSLQEGDVNYASPAGDGLPVLGPLFLTQLGAGITLHPDTRITGHAQLSVGPAVTNNGCGALGLDGDVAIDFGNPWSLDASGSASLLCKSLGPSKRFHADSDGHFSYDEAFNYPVADFAQVSGDLGGAAYYNTNTRQLDLQLDGTYTARGGIHVCVIACVDAGFTANADATLALGLHGGKLVGGTGLCLHLNTSIGGFDVGAGISDLPGALLSLGSGDATAALGHADVLLSGCDVSRWRLIAHASQAGPVQVSEPGGQKLALIGLTGAGGAPAVVLNGPGGKQINATQDGISTAGGALIVRQASTGHTLVEIPHAAAGTWTVTPVAGSAPLRGVETAQPLALPAIHAHVSGRVLRYSLTPQPGVAVAFAADGQLLRGAAGRLRLPDRAATIRAQFTRDGVPLGSRIVARYRPPRLRPGRAKAIRVRAHGGRWTLAWRPGANATLQLLTVRYADGAQVLLEARGAQRSLTLDRRVQPTAVQIVGLRGQTRGPAASVTARHP